MVADFLAMPVMPGIGVVGIDQGASFELFIERDLGRAFTDLDLLTGEALKRDKRFQAGYGRMEGKQLNEAQDVLSGVGQAVFILAWLGPGEPGVLLILGEIFCPQLLR